MRCCLTDREFASLMDELNRLNNARKDAYSITLAPDVLASVTADAKREGILSALLVMGFGVSFDARGYVIDIDTD